MQKRKFHYLFTFFLLLSLSAVCEETFFRSNSLGIAFERIESGNMSNFRYVLSIDEASGLKYLLEEGTETKRWEYIASSNNLQSEEREYSGGNLISQYFYSADGLIVEKLSFQENLFFERSVYQYNDSLLSELEKFDGEGNSLYREKYFYTNSGHLREISRFFPDGKHRVSSFSIVDGRLTEERFLEGPDLFIARYGLGGKLLDWEKWEGPELVFIKTVEYYPDEKTVRTLDERDLKEGLQSVKQYNQNGYIMLETLEGKISEKITYFRDSDGRVEEKIKIGSDGKEQWEYKYSDEGAVVSESYFKKGSLERIRFFRQAELWYEALYRNDSIFLRVYYEKEEKIREEFIKNGQVINVRIYGER